MADIVAVADMKVVVWGRGARVITNESMWTLVALVGKVNPVGWPAVLISRVFVSGHEYSKEKEKLLWMGLPEADFATIRRCVNAVDLGRMKVVDDAGSMSVPRDVMSAIMM